MKRQVSPRCLFLVAIFDLLSKEKRCRASLATALQGSLRRGTEAGEGLGEIGQVIAFGAEIANSHGLRADAEGAESATQARYGKVDCWIAGLLDCWVGPRARGKERKGGDKFFRKHSRDAGLGEDIASVGQKELRVES